ncbi:pilin [Vagococcus xieshaowenii]|uniref:Uncharacterized protein n=1 Tax=Vagococcus xieshaowenii TaxID=2562451 RepID=A0AAJ5EGT0_9ENTE|nr:pilin [Vagococcus xieshaowenii]QCA29676.1 hypothetical protein E4Z98_09830 [Vagococcus xieshaowenii]TFZ42951.1 hypothetical protein E4031_01570 [Vagococcus xieshaowenii]
MKDMIIQAKTHVLIGATDPGQMMTKIFNDIEKWLLAGIVGYAVVQFILAMFGFMSKEPQKHSQAKDHAIHACIGIVGAFAATTIMTYLKTQATSWTAMQSIVETFLA